MAENIHVLETMLELMQLFAKQNVLHDMILCSNFPFLSNNFTKIYSIFKSILIENEAATRFVEYTKKTVEHDDFFHAYLMLPLHFHRSLYRTFLVSNHKRNECEFFSIDRF